jgi:hypothetical protein
MWEFEGCKYEWVLIISVKLQGLYIMLSKSMLQCTNGVGSNPADGREKNCQLKI